MSSLALKEEAAALVSLDEARRQIAIAAQAGDVDTLREIRDQGRIVAFHFRHRAGGRAYWLAGGEQMVRAERELGRLDLRVAPHGVNAAHRGVNGGDNSSPLADVRPNTRAAWRRLGRISDDEFDALMEKLRDDDPTGVTTAGAVRLARGRNIADSALMSSATDEWATPQDLFDALDREFHFGLDVCATPENAKCGRFFTRDDDGLAQPWAGTCWMNPPYGQSIGRWVEKAHASAIARSIVVCLLPARVDTGWWWDHARYGEIRFLRGRLRFGDAAHTAPFPSCVVIFGRPATVRWWER